ncbi:hypothetical protein JMUB7523_16290 [Staphylococcus aureus]
MKKLIIRVVGVLFLVGFLIYLFYSPRLKFDVLENCLLYTSDAADDLTRVDLGGRRIIKK